MANKSLKKFFDRPKTTGMSRPEAAGNFDNMDDFNIVKAVTPDEGTIQHTPANHKDIVNKEYVDNSIPASVSLFFTENGSDLGGVYLDMEVDPVTAGEENTLTAIPANSTGTLMATFATLLNDSVISGIVELPVGVYSFHVHCQASSAAKLSMYAELYHRNVGGTETLLLTTESSNLIPIAKGSIGFHGSLLTEKDWASTDRIVVKLYGKNNSAASRNLTIYVEGDTASRAELPAIRGSTTVAGLWEVDGAETQLITADEIDMQTKKIINVVGPAANQDAATKKYVDDLTDPSLLDDSMADTLHRHSELSASDGTPDQAVFVDANGNVTIDGALGIGKAPAVPLDVNGNVTIDGNIIVTGTVDGIDIATDVAANTIKDTNVSTDLSAGTRAPTTIDVNSSDGTNATLVEADTTNAGILGSDKWDEIVANSTKTSYTKTNVKGHVFHDSTAGTARATGFTSVEWVGSVEPTNAVNGDTWIDTT